jgi:methionyl-tRNA formyltransferase
MPKEILLLTGRAEAPRLGEWLKERNPALAVTHVETRDALEDACRRPLAGARLVAFATSVVVPAAVLASLPSPAYNFHPGPPTYPGSYGVSFALYDGATRFGATAHAMTERVDEGAIVGVEWFDVPGGIDRFGLEVRTYEALARLFLRLAGALAADDAPLSPIGVAWSGRKTTRREYERMRAVPPGMDAAEAARRRRAFAE